MASVDPTFQSRVRVGGVFTVFTFGGFPITFCQQVSYTSPQPVGGGMSAIQPMDEPYPIEIITPVAAGPGQIVLNMFELFGSGGTASKVWDRLGLSLGAKNGPFGSETPENQSTNFKLTGPNNGGIFMGAVDIVDIFIRQAQASPAKTEIVKIIRPLGASGPAGSPITPYTEEYHGCFAGHETYITDEGIRSFEDSVGETVHALTKSGFVTSKVNYLGKQPLNRIRLKPMSKMRHPSGGNMWRTAPKSNFSIEIEATPNHRWIKANGSITDNLAVGDRLMAHCNTIDTFSESYQDGMRHGLVFGDGTHEYQQKTKKQLHRHALRIYGDSMKAAANDLFDDIHIEQSNVGPEKGIGYGGTAIAYATQNFKELPERTDNADYLAGFIAGWGIADAHYLESGRIKINSSNHEALEWLEEYAAFAGYVVIGKGEDPTDETNYGKRTSRMRYVTLADASTVCWKVDSIESTGHSENVYCLDVPDEHAFTLSNGVYTGNCVITGVQDGEQIAVGTMEVLKQVTVSFRYVTRNSNPSLAFRVRDNPL